eukprot:1062205_1
MLLIAILLSITGLTYGTTVLNVSVANCSAADAMGSILSLQTLPGVPELNQAFTLRSYIYTNQAIGMNGTFTMGDPDIQMAGSVCVGNSTSGKWGEMSFIAAQCPVMSGNFNLSLSVYISSATVPYADVGNLECLMVMQERCFVHN